MTKSVELIDAIYEAAVVTEQWRDVLQEIAAETASAFGSLVLVPHWIGDAGESAQVNDMRWIGTPEGEALIADFAGQAAPLVNSRVPRGYAMRPHGFFGDLDLFSNDEIACDPFYTDFLHPRGYGWFAGSIIEVATGDSMILSFERHREQGPVERAQLAWLDGLRPHLARAAFLSLQLRQERARTFTTALADFGLAASVIDGLGRPLAMNGKMEALPFVVERALGQGLALRPGNTDELFQRALMGLRSDPAHEDQAVWSIPVPATASDPAHVIHLIPLRREARGCFEGGETVILAMPVEPHRVPPPQLLRSLFDLTPAEAKLAEGVAEGQSLDQAARALGVSIFTSRAQMRALFGKTGTHRQSDLVRVLAAIPWLPE